MKSSEFRVPGSESGSGGVGNNVQMVRPHPGPLPLERDNSLPRPCKLLALDWSLLSGTNGHCTGNASGAPAFSRGARSSSLSLGVRASVILSFFSLQRSWPCVFRQRVRRALLKRFVAHPALSNLLKKNGSRFTLSWGRGPG